MTVCCTCACGRSFTQAEWNALPICGGADGIIDDGVQRLELRQCPCGSTRSIVLQRYADVDVDYGDAPNWYDQQEARDRLVREVRDVAHAAQRAGLQRSQLETFAELYGRDGLEPHVAAAIATGRLATKGGDR